VRRDDPGQSFFELDSRPETLLPQAMPKLAQTAFLLWKCGQGEFAKQILFTCLAWYLKNFQDQEEISAITKNIQYIFDKDGRSLAAEEIRQVAKVGHAQHAGLMKTRQ
jgi:hypothetical protein